MTPTQHAVAAEIMRLHDVKAAHGTSELIVQAALEIVALRESLAEAVRPRTEIVTESGVHEVKVPA